MCGIIALESKGKTKSATKPLLKRYRHQASRGKLGFGYVTVDDKGMVSDVTRSTTEAEIVEALLKEQTDFIMFHHRTPTSLPNHKEATHPFVVKNDKLKYNYYVIHNGVISNWKILYDQFKKDGYVFNTEMMSGKYERFGNVPNTPSYGDEPEYKINDSEVFAIDLARWIEGEYDTFKSYGSIAFIALQTTKEGKVVNLIYGHNGGSPLTEENDKTIYALKSVGHGKEVDEMKIYTKDWKTGNVTSKHALGMSGYFSRKKDKEEDERNGWGGMGFRGRGANSEDDEPETEDTKNRRHRPHSQSFERDLEGLKDSEAYKEWEQNQARTRQSPLALSDSERKLLMAGQPTLDWDTPSTAELEAGYERYLAENELPIIDIDDLGFSEEALKIELNNAEFDGNHQTARMIRELKGELETAISDENDANLQVRMAQEMLVQAWKREDDVEDVATAKELVTSAEGMAVLAKDKRIAVQAELEAHIDDLHGAGSDE